MRRAAEVTRTGTVDYSRKVSMPIRDFGTDGRIVFWVDVYGVDPQDVTTVVLGEPPPDYVGSRPFRKAVERLGLDPNRFMATLMDIGRER